jgi:hypothetical protein
LKEISMSKFTPFVYVAIACVLTGCDSVSRPSEAEVRQCVLAAVGKMEHYPWSPTLTTITRVDFGKTMTSQGGMIELALGAPKGTKIFPVRVYFEKAGYMDFWVFSDSFGKQTAVQAPS